jgi:hypothetical protein
MEMQVVRFQRARRLAEASLNLDAQYHRSEHLRAVATQCLSKRQCGRERRRQCVRGGKPHRLEVEHVHRRAIDQSRWDDSQPRVQAQERGC